MITLWCFSIHFLSPLNIIHPIPTTRKILYSTGLSLFSVVCRPLFIFIRLFQNLATQVHLFLYFVYLHIHLSKREREGNNHFVKTLYTISQKKIFFSLHLSAFGSYSWHGSTELLPFHFHSILISRRSVKYEHTNTGKRRQCKKGARITSPGI